MRLRKSELAGCVLRRHGLSANNLKRGMRLHKRLAGCLTLSTEKA